MPDSLIKGGTAIDLRRGTAPARLSKDLDAAIRGDLGGFIDQARALLDAGWSGFTGRLARETEIDVPGLLVKPRRVRRPNGPRPAARSTAFRCDTRSHRRFTPAQTRSMARETTTAPATSSTCNCSP
jgi:hypothetical protein